MKLPEGILRTPENLLQWAIAKACDGPDGQFGMLYSRRVEASKAILATLKEAGLVIEEGWRPFDTAPEDGGVILAHREDAGVFTAHHTFDLDETEELWFTTGGHDLTGELPTEWRPLPLGPIEETAKE